MQPAGKPSKGHHTPASARSRQLAALVQPDGSLSKLEGGPQSAGLARRHLKQEGVLESVDREGDSFGVLRSDFSEESDCFDGNIVDVIGVRYANEQAITILSHVKKQASEFNAGMTAACCDPTGGKNKSAIHTFGADCPGTAIRR